MNDRFKFRIWHKPLKQMHYNDFIVTATGYMAKIYQQDDYMMKFNQEDLEFDKQCILMQCTGLKDKNGKLIYEGDVVKVDKNTYADSCLLEQFENENAMITYREELGRYNIEFMPKDNSGCNVMDLMADFYYFLKWKPCGKLEYGILEYIEVIGNIYENKELLEDTECQE